MMRQPARVAPLKDDRFLEPLAVQDVDRPVQAPVAVTFDAPAFAFPHRPLPVDRQRRGQTNVRRAPIVAGLPLVHEENPTGLEAGQLQQLGQHDVQHALHFARPVDRFRDFAKKSRVPVARVVLPHRTFPFSR